MQRKPPAQLLEFLAPYPLEVKKLFLATRKTVFEYTPRATEVVVDAANAVATGCTFTHSSTQGFIHIAAYSTNVNLGFNFGAELSDPKQLLLGEGTKVRHISIRSLDDLNDLYLHGLIRQAVAKAYRPRPPLTPTTIVKVMKGRRRRPTS
ncbi:MAG: hypothetical protein ACREJQ_02700 [bacterium]